LFLIQLENQAKVADRQKLASMGVELLKYVPDDAFIARFNQVSPSQVHGLSFIRWIGQYRPEHKDSSPAGRCQAGDFAARLPAAHYGPDLAQASAVGNCIGAFGIGLCRA
jgi:hypothetical protein